MSDTLSAEDRRRLEDLFDRAADLPAEEHAGFAERECGANASLRDELSKLLAGLTGDDLLLRLRQSDGPGPGSQIGPYKLLEKIGEGGMGEVFAAAQLTPIRRRVALKLIKPGMDSAEVIARFEAERQALARMTHPGVAQVYDGGTTPDGRPYFAMELVAGEPVHEYCDRRKLATRERLELFIEICQGVQHAHQKGLIHRDLKPSNLLVSQQDGIARPKIIDFGVARATTGTLAEHTLYTMAGQIIGTLDYMSPEQADPTGVDVDTRSDVYSLGVVLYQLLSGMLPFEHLRGAPLSEIQRAIRETDPPTPSTRVRALAAEIAALHGTDARSLVHSMAGDLDWICMKALEKDPNRRYQTAAELADDVRRHLADEPVRAGRPGAAYRARKFIRRHRVAVVATLLVGSGVLAGVIGIVAGQLRTQAQKPYADAYRLKTLEPAAGQDLWPGRLKSLADVDTWIDAMNAWLPKAEALVANLEDHRADLSRAKAAGDNARIAALTGLVAGLETLRDDVVGLLGTDAHAVSPEHGWSIPRRLAFARKLRSGFDKDGEYTRAWQAARREDPGLDLKPQIGLVPISRDRESKQRLWEFAHLMSGAPATRGDDGKLVLTEATGVVLVLIPANDSFWMGAQSSDEHGRNFERDAWRSVELPNNEKLDLPSDRPMHKVVLSPYFVSKYELTQGQWRWMTGQRPSRYGPKGHGGTWQDQWLASGAPPSDMHPVEQVSWTDCMRWLPHFGLTLPSEAQWENAARAGTDTAFWSGPKPKDLQGVANLSDLYSIRHGGLEHARPVIDLDDDSTMHAPVDAYRPNDFGLHNVHGNVYEWCLDFYVRDFYRSSHGKDPVARGIGEDLRVVRGGSYRSSAPPARSSARSYYPPRFRGHALGVRPAWIIRD